MLNSAEITVAHRKTYTIVDKCFRICYLASFWIKHPILSYSLHKEDPENNPWVQLMVSPGIFSPDIRYKILSRKGHIVAFQHKDYKGINYVSQMLPQTRVKVQREMEMFFKHYAALESARESDYIMDDPRERGKRYNNPGNTYRSGNR